MTEQINPSPPGEGKPLPAGLPHVAYVLLWYPLFTQPFIFREVEGLKEHLPLTVYSLYARNLRHCSTEMRAAADSVRTFGIKAAPHFALELLRQLLTHPLRLCRLFRRSLFRRWRSLETFGENLWAFGAGLYLGRRFREDGIDMVHAPWPRGATTAAWVAADIAGVPFSTSARGDNLEPADPDLADKLSAALFVRANNAADQARIEAFDHSRARGKVALVYNSLTFTERTECALPMRPPYRLLAVGRFARTKGFPELLTAMARLRREQVPVRLTLVGDGGWRRKLTALRRRLRLTGCVDMPGFLPHDRLREFMQNHDMLVVPSVVHSNGDRDGIPNVIMEALSHRMPVVATDVCGISEVIRDGETGLLVPQRDPRALAQAVRRMLEDREQALRMAEAGRALVEQMFDRDTNITALRDLYLSADRFRPAKQG